jgi:hypothetical protein
MAFRAVVPMTAVLAAKTLFVFLGFSKTGAPFAGFGAVVTGKTIRLEIADVNFGGFFSHEDDRIGKRIVATTKLPVNVNCFPAL